MSATTIVGAPSDAEIVERWAAALKAAQPAEARYKAMGGPSVVDVILSVPKPDAGRFDVLFAPERVKQAP